MKKGRSIAKYVGSGLGVMAVGSVTGGLAGLVVTLFNVLFEYAEDFSRGYYAFFRTHPAFLPLLFLALFLGAVAIGGVLKALPVLRGSGFAQTEGAARGLFRFKWYQALTGMFACGLFCVFCGLSAGGEGPSAMIGGSCGTAVANLLKRPSDRRYQLTGGACAGLAVGLNAPLTGIIFAYEEAHKRFTPEVFVCSFSSVAAAIVVRNLLYPLFGLSAEAFAGRYSFAENTPLSFCLFALAAAVVVSLAAVGFYYLIRALRRLFRKLSFWKGMGKFLIPFLFAGACGLVAEGVIGSGVHLIRGLAAGSETGLTVFGVPLWAGLLIVLALKFLSTALNVGCDLPACSSVPMLAMGAVIGKLLGFLFVKWGMDPAFADTLTVLGMVTFFTTVVKAPITAVIMAVELTWNFTFLLPAVICASVSYLMGELFRTEPLYEVFLDEILLERREKAEHVSVRLTASEALGGRAVRDVLWPFTALVTEICRGAETISPTGDTVLYAGDILSVEGEPDDRKEYLADLSALGSYEIVSAAENGEATPPDAAQDGEKP